MYSQALAAIMLLLAPFEPSYGQLPDLKTEKTLKKNLIEIERQLVNSCVNHDTSFLNSLFDDDALFVGTRGEFSSKQQQIDELGKEDVCYRVFDKYAIRPKIYSNTAVVTTCSHIIATVKPFDHLLEITIQVIDIFVLKNDKWQLVASQAMELKR